MLCEQSVSTVKGAKRSMLQICPAAFALGIMLERAVIATFLLEFHTMVESNFALVAPSALFLQCVMVVS